MHRVLDRVNAWLPYCHERTLAPHMRTVRAYTRFVTSRATFGARLRVNASGNELVVLPPDASLFIADTTNRTSLVVRARLDARC